MNKRFNQIFPSQQDNKKPASTAGFSFLSSQRGPKKGLNMKYVNYRPARISRGKKWYVAYQYLIDGKWETFKVYENINRIHDEDEKEEFAQGLAEAINRMLKEGYNPIEEEEEIVFKVWTLSQCLNYFKTKLYERGLRLRTIQSYESVLRMLNKKLSPVLNKEITLIRKQHIQAVLSGNNWSATTYNNNLTFIKAIFNFLIDAEIIKENPARAIKPLPETITRHRYFDSVTWDKVKKKASPELLEFMIFLYNTGTRPNEARQLRYEQINEGKLLIPGSIAKNRKDRFIPLSKNMTDKYKGTGLIFGTSVNHYSNKFREEVKKPLKLNKDYTLYSIKGTRGVHMYEDGVSIYNIMLFFGHHSLEVTQRYLRGLGLQLNTEAADKVRDI